METSFNLLSEPWIPVICRDGTADELGLRDALHLAPELREIRDPIPIVEFGLYRFLTALVTDIFDLKGLRSLSDLLDEGCFDDRRVDAYFKRWADRFDLFHPVHPFLQSADTDGEKKKPLSGLLPMVPSGTAANFFHHADENDFGVSPAMAARLLTTVAPFMTAGGQGLSPSINGSPPWYILIEQEDLFRTIYLNCCAIELPYARGNAPAAWCNDSPVSRGRRSGASLLEALTWRPRRIQLIPGEAGRCSLTGIETPVLVRTMKFTAGALCAASCGFSWRDPSVPYRIGVKGAQVMRPQEGRHLWRDTGPIAFLREGDYVSEDGRVRFERPAVVTQFAMLANEGWVAADTVLSLRAYGMRIKDLKMNLQEWHREILRLPTPLVWRSAFRVQAQRGMEQADRVAYHLRRAVKRAYPRAGEGNKNAFDSLIADIERQFWAVLRPHYDELLGKLAELRQDSDEHAITECLSGWKEKLRRTGSAGLESAIGDLDTDADAIKRQVDARRVFFCAVQRIFESPEEAKARKERSRSKNQQENLEEGGSDL